MTHRPFSIKTPRLELREFRAEDAEPLFKLNSDPEVLRYTGDDPFADERSAAEFIRNYAHYDIDTDEFLGFCGLRLASPEADVDLGFRLFQRHWARGYATEAARAALTAGFETFGLAEITGRAMRQNLPSISVLQKLGMQFREVAEENELLWLVYAICAERYRTLRHP